MSAVESQSRRVCHTKIEMSKPYMVVRASIEPSMMEEFVRWYEREHLPHVMKIPAL